LSSKAETTIEFYIISFCNGNNDAIALQFKKWIPEFYVIAYRYLKNQDDAEDVVADCFEKLLQMPLVKRKQKFIGDAINLKALLIVIIKNKCLDQLKTSKNRNRIIDGIKSLWPSSTNNTVKETFSIENFDMMLGCLPEKEQSILKMNLDGFKHSEISEKLNISEKTISNSLSMSRSKIKNMWNVFME
jgi:RNA polymerase sigma factor (sigma-70 family)